MSSLYTHGKSFLVRLMWLSPLMGGIFPTVSYLFNARGKPMKIGRINYVGAELEFRNVDLTVVKEVLIDEEYHFLRPFLKLCSSPIIVDIGAHIGMFSLWVYNQNPKAKIFSVEANPTSYELLLRNIRQVFSKERCKVLNKAAWKNADVVTFSTKGNPLGNRVSPDGNIKITGISLADIVETLCKDSLQIDLMKIDIEGAEEAFFKNTGSELDKVKRLVIELHPANCDTKAVRKKLEKRYKNVQEIPGRKDSKPIIYCTDDF